MEMVRKFTETIVYGAGTIKETYTKVQIELGPCPKCKKGIITEGKKSYNCSFWKDDCTFTIWKSQFGKTYPMLK